MQQEVRDEWLRHAEAECARPEIESALGDSVDSQPGAENREAKLLLVWRRADDECQAEDRRGRDGDRDGKPATYSLLPSFGSASPSLSRCGTPAPRPGASRPVFTYVISLS